MPKTVKTVLSAACIAALVFTSAGCGRSPFASSPAVSAQLPSDSQAVYQYFDDAVFIGDCVSVGLKNYVTEKRNVDRGFMGKAVFLTAAGLGATNALEAPGPDSKHPVYKGEKLAVEDAVARTGAKKAYVMLGLMDLHFTSTDVTAKNLDTLIGRIREKSPGITICVQSVTPITRDGETKQVNNRSINAYNEKLKALCRTHGYRYLDLAGALRDGGGFLPASYSSNDEAHPNDIFCSIWIDYLLTHPV